MSYNNNNNGNSNKNNVNSNNGSDRPQFDVAAQTLTLAPETLAKMHSPIIREWNTADVMFWLDDIFNEAEILPEYREQFRKNGVRGLDLLNLGEAQMTQLGIVSALHVSRVKACVAQLQYSQYTLDEAAKDKAQQDADALYSRMESKYAELTANPDQPYLLPESMDKWTPIDVLYWIKMPEYQENLHMFVKPLVLNRITGKELVELGVKKDPLKTEERVGFLVKETTAGKRNFQLPGLVCEDLDITRFQKAVMDFKKNLDETRKRLRGEWLLEVGKGLVKIDMSKVNLKSSIGNGAFSKVYLGEYQKKKVVVKVLKVEDERAMLSQLKNKKKKGGKKKEKTEAEKKAEEDKKEADKRKQDMLKDSSIKLPRNQRLSKEQLLAEDMEYEAVMTYLAAGNGVLKIIGYDTRSATQPPCLVVEYLCHSSVESELRKAQRNDPSANDSIFSPYNETNIIEADENGVRDPVLLQAVRIARDVAEALAGIHAKGILHLDIAARNILLDAGKRPKIADFGCATSAKSMQEVFEFRKQKIAEFGTHRAFHVKYEQALEDPNEDPNLWRNSYMHLHSRASKWMPDHVVAKSEPGKPRNPELTYWVDVYSFGCFMLELITGKAPHHGVSDEEIIALKNSNRGTPTIPSEVDPRYAAIMSNCWDKSKAVPMKQVAKLLTDLHKEISTESCRRTADYDDLMKFAQSNVSFGQYSNNDAPHSAAGYSSVDSAPMSAAGYSSPDDLPEPTTSGPRVTTTPMYNVAPGRIRFDGTFDVSDVRGVAEMQNKGMLKEALVAALHCAFKLRDHETIEKIMMCVRMDNDANQVEMIRLCLEHLSKLADDEHGYTDAEESWHRLCRSVLKVAKVAATILDAGYRGIILSQSLLAFAALLKRKTMAEDGPDAALRGEGLTTHFELDIADLTIATFAEFPHDTKVVETAAACVCSLANLSFTVIGKLHLAGTIGLLVDAILMHRNDDKLVLNCIKALERFPLIDLIDPRATDRKIRETRDRRNLPPLPTPPQVARAWGEVFEAVFTVARNTSRCLVDTGGHRVEQEVPPGHVSKVDLLETCLQMLFKSCEDGIHAPRQIEQFLYTVDLNVVADIVFTLTHFPDVFRIQEGAIGLLSNVIDSGSQLFMPVYEMQRQVRQGFVPQNVPTKVPLATTSKQRMTKLLELDPQLKLLLDAMAKFSTNDKIAEGIKTTILGGDTVEGQYQQSGVFNTMTRTATFSSGHGGDRYSLSDRYGQTMLGYGEGGRYGAVGGAGYGGGGYGGGAGGYGYGGGRGIYSEPEKAFYSSGGDNEENDEEDEWWADFRDSIVNSFLLQIDGNGDSLSAANLQRSVAMILGIASSTHPDVQDALVNTRYNELIMLAFKHFPGDVNLIRYGCHALFATCRGHAKHQRILHELNVFKTLVTCLETHNMLMAWPVMDGVICAIIGLLEPNAEVHDVIQVKALLEADAKSKAVSGQIRNSVAGLSTDQDRADRQRIKSMAAQRRITFDGYTIAREITQRAKVGYEDNADVSLSLLQKLALYVAEFQMNEQCHPIAANFLKLVTCVTFWLPDLLIRWEQQEYFVNLTLSSRLAKEVARKFFKNIIVWQLHQVHNSEMRKQSNSLKRGPAMPNSPSNATATITTTATVSTVSSKMNANSEKAGEKAETTTVSKYLAEHDEQYNLKSVTLLQFVQIAMLWHEHQPHVLSAALAINMAVYRTTFSPEEFIFGAELPYRYHIFRIDAGGELQPNNTTGPFWHRRQVCENGLVNFCMAPMLYRQENPGLMNNPVLLRYALWNIILLISQHKEDIDANPDNFVKLLVKYLESSFSVLQQQQQPPSNAGAIASLVATEGMIEWALHVADGYPDHYSLQCAAIVFWIWMENHGRLSNRGHDLLENIKRVVMRNLNRRIESFLSLTDEGHDAYLMGQDTSVFGLLSLHCSKLLRLLEKRLLREEPVEAMAYETWDNICRPLKLVASNVEAEEDPRTLKKINMYAINIEWGRPDPKWRITVRFVGFHDLDKVLRAEFFHLGDIFRATLPPRRHRLRQMLMSDQAGFLETRRVEIQKWLDAITSNRVTLNSRTFQHFCRIPPDCQLRAIRMLPTLNCVPMTPLLPVQSVTYCQISQLVFVCRGIPKSSINFVSKTVVRGSLNIFQLVDGSTESTGPISWAAAGYKMMLALSQMYNVGVMGLAWDINRRNVILGLSTGPILFYYLSQDCSTLTYCSELDCHNNLLCNLIYEPKNNMLLGGSNSGSLSCFDCDQGQTTTQLGKGCGPINSIAYARQIHVVFVGTKDGHVVIYDLKFNPPKEMKRFALTQGTNNPKLQKLDNKGDVYVVYVEETRQLIATHFHEIYVWDIPRNDLIASTNYHVSTCKAKFFLNCQTEHTAKICSLLVFHYGNYICVSTTRGNVVLFDMSDAPKEDTLEEAMSKAAKNLSGANNSTSSASADVNYLSTTYSALVHWWEIIKRNNTALRDWLRANGVDATLALTRADLIALVIEYYAGTPENVTSEIIADQLRAKKPRMDPLLTWNLNSMEYIPETVTSIDGADPRGGDAIGGDGSSKSAKRATFREPPPFIVSSCFLDEIGSLAFGTREGKVELVSIAAFLPPLSSEEKRDLTHIRTQMSYLDTNVQGIKGSTKSSRGKRHEYAP